MNSGSECQTKTDRQIEDRRERNVLNDCVVVFSCCVHAAQRAEALQSHKANTMSMSVDECGMVGLWHHILNHPAQPEPEHAAQLILNFLQPVSRVFWVSFKFAHYNDWCMQYDDVPAAQAMCWPQKRVVFKCLILLELTSTTDKHFLRSTFCEWSRCANL